MLFSESRCFYKKQRPIPPPIMDADGQIIESLEHSNNTSRSSSISTAPPTRPARAYSNKALQVPAQSPIQQSSTSPSWMRKFSLPTSSRSTSSKSSRTSSISSAHSPRKLSLPLIRRRKGETAPESIQEQIPSLWTHHSNGYPRTVFKNAGRDERGRLRLEYVEYDEVAW